MPTVSAVNCSVGAGQQRHDFLEELHRDAHHVDGLAQRDATGQILRHHLEGLRRVADVAAGIAHPLDEVDHRGLHDQLDAGPLRGLQLGEERQPLLHARATAWVANRPEYCLSRRSSESGTFSSSSSGRSAGGVNRLLSASLKATPLFWRIPPSRCRRERPGQAHAGV